MFNNMGLEQCSNDFNVNKGSKIIWCAEEFCKLMRIILTHKENEIPSISKLIYVDKKEEERERERVT